jgi:hypothetical protein
MLGNLAISPCSATVAARRNSRGPAVDANAPLHDSQTLYSLVAKFANVYALDPDNQATHPPSVHAFYVNGCEVKDANTKIDKLVVMMQVANPDNIEYVTGKLSNNKKSILIQAPDISPWIVDNQEVIATSLAKKLNPTEADEVRGEASALISSIAACHSGTPSCLPAQDSNMDIAMKMTTLLLPPHLTGSNHLFNHGRWKCQRSGVNHNFPFLCCYVHHLSIFQSLATFHSLFLGWCHTSDAFQLQPYIFVELQIFDKDTLDNMFEDTYLNWEMLGDREDLTITSKTKDGGDTMSLFFQAATRTAAEQSKALFLCFQIAINDTAVQLSVKKNELKHNKSAKKAAFAFASMTSKKPPCRTAS